MGCFLSFDVTSQNKLAQFTYECERRQHKIIWRAAAIVSALIATKLHRILWVCVWIRTDKTLCFLHFLPSNQTYSFTRLSLLGSLFQHVSYSESKHLSAIHLCWDRQKHILMPGVNTATQSFLKISFTFYKKITLFWNNMGVSHFWWIIPLMKASFMSTILKIMKKSAEQMLFWLSLWFQG